MNSANMDAGGSGPIVDFSRLQRAFFVVDSRSDIEQVYELIKVTTRLVFVAIRAHEQGE